MNTRRLALPLSFAALAFACGTESAPIPDAEQPSGQSKTSREPDASADEPTPGVDAGDPEVSDAGREAEAPATFDSPCDPLKNPTGCPTTLSAPGVAGTATVYCFSSHTAPGVTSHDLYGHCTFSCTGDKPDQIDSQKEQICFAFGGTCRPWKAGGIPMCMPLP